MAQVTYFAERLTPQGSDELEWFIVDGQFEMRIKSTGKPFILLTVEGLVTTGRPSRPKPDWDQGRIVEYLEIDPDDRSREIYQATGLDLPIWFVDEDEFDARNKSPLTLIEQMFEAADRIEGGHAADLIEGYRGNDTLEGGAANDTLLGAEGADLLLGQDGNDLLQGAIGADALKGGPGNDQVEGDAGRDTLEGGLGADQLLGGSEGDEIFGGPGHDLIEGGTGDDTLRGQDGRDTVIGGAGRDLIYGGAGDDLLRAGPGDTVIGGTGEDHLDLRGAGPVLMRFTDTARTAGTAHLMALGAELSFDGIETFETDSLLDEKVRGTAGADTINPSFVDRDGDRIDGQDAFTATGAFTQADAVFAGAGDDLVLAGQGADTVVGGPGDDRLFGQVGDDRLVGQNGADVLRGALGADLLLGGMGADLLEGGLGSDTLQGGAGHDSLNGEDDDDSLDGGTGNDSLIGGGGADTGQGGAGADTLRGNDGADLLQGGDGADVLSGDLGLDTLNGGRGADSLDGGAGADRLAGNAGDDLLDGRAGPDHLDGGLGNDTVSGHDGADTLVGGDGADSLNGGAAPDLLEGGAQADTLRGGAGLDTLRGGAGADLIFAGAGDVVEGGPGTDQMDLSGAGPIRVSYSNAAQTSGVVSFVDQGTRLTFQSIETLVADEIQTPTVTDDLVLVFTGGFAANSFTLLGLQEDGAVVELLSDGFVDNRGRSYENSISLTGAGYVTMGDDLYFNAYATQLPFGANPATYSTVMRVTGEGFVERVILDQRGSIVQSGLGYGGGFSETATAYDGDYVAVARIAFNHQLVSYGADGSRDVLTNFTRSGATVQGEFAAVADELYFIADERSPLGVDELWRLNGDGSQEFLWVDSTGLGRVSDVEEFGNSAWFTVSYGNNRPASQGTELYTVAPGGTPVEIDLSAHSELFSAAGAGLRVLDDRLFMVTYRQVYEIGTDGTVSQVMPNGRVDLVRGMTVLDGQVYVAADGPEGSSVLYREDSMGSWGLVPDIPYSSVTISPTFEFFNGAVEELAVAGDTLYFTMNTDVDDGFGGLQTMEVLASLNADGTYTQISDVGGTVPTLTGVGGLFAFETDIIA